MYKGRRNRKIIIGSLLSLLLMITVGYAAFQTRLEIKGSSKITSNWDVRITNVTSGTATGNAENASEPTFTDLTAYMEANLYEKGASMEYDVTISNRGTFDANLDNIITTPSSNDAVIITFSGYTKGEPLLKGQDKVIHVKIEYNPEYNGNAEVSGTSSVEFQYVQGEGSNIPVTTRYLLTYDYAENGGTTSNTQNEYLDEGTIVNLEEKTATKEGYTFVGWNTDKDANTGLSTTTMTADTSLYAIFKKDITITYTKDENVTSIGKESDTCSMYNKETTCSLTLPIITVTSGNYEVDGWYEGSTKVGTSNDTITVSENKSLVAKAILNGFTLTYNYNGATGGNSETSKLVTNTYGTLPVPTKEYTVTYNYNGATSGNSKATDTASSTFDGWYKESTFNNVVTSNTPYTLTTDSTIYARWTDGTVTLPTPEKTDYSFAGWYSDSSFTAKVGDGGDVYTPTSDIELFAKFTAPPVLQSWTSSASTDFHSSTYKSKITSVVFEDHTNVPEGATSWDVGATKDGGVMAWVTTDPNDSTKYTLHIGGNGGVIANADSSNIFRNFTNLKSINFGKNFDTSKAQNMSYMFYYCSNLNTIDLENIKTDNVTNMSYMFRYCSSFTTLDVSSFNTSNVSDMRYMFGNMTNLTTIYASDNFVTTGITTSSNGASMFSSDSKLEGGNGTKFSSSYTNMARAKIDKTGQAGYFTDYLSVRVATSATTNSITVTGGLHSDLGNITKYEFSSDDGATWINNGTSNVYTFSSLTRNTSYPIKVRVTTTSGTYTSNTKNVTTNDIAEPTYKVKYTSATNGDVTITYPSGCGSTYTCKYTKNNNSPVTVTSTTKVVNYTADGELTATVSDGTNTVSSSFTVTMPTKVISPYGVDMLVMKAGDGLYENSDGSYTYKGENPANYIKLGTDMYRIMEIDKDGNLKVIRDATISLPWDPGYSTSISGITNSSSIKGTRYAGLSSNTTDYCVSASTKENNYYGCKAWGSKYSTLDRNGNSILNQNTQIAQMPWEAGSTTLRNLPEYDSYINAYLNGKYYPCDASISGCENGKKKLTAWYETNVASTLQSKIVDHLWNIGPVKQNNSDLATDISQAEAYKWSGKVGLMNVIDYVKASTNPACTNVAKYYNNTTANKVCYENSNTHNWLYKSSMQWTMAPVSGSGPRYVWLASGGGNLNYNDAKQSNASRPAFYLSSNIQLTGTGESTSNAYTITN